MLEKTPFVSAETMYFENSNRGNCLVHKFDVA